MKRLPDRDPTLSFDENMRRLRAAHDENMRSIDRRASWMHGLLLVFVAAMLAPVLIQAARLLMK